jgi:hypothetical protein
VGFEGKVQVFANGDGDKLTESPHDFHGEWQ